MKVFNTTAVCIPSKHYMVDLSERLKEIKKLVDDGKYFIINRARQYGKTTTLKALQNSLVKEYIVLNFSFEGITGAGSQTEGEFVQTFSRLILDRYEFYGMSIPEKILKSFEGFCDSDPAKIKMDELYRTFRRWIVISEKPVVMLIDEVDAVTNNQVFLDFLGLLRDGYIAREADNIPTFQSVILAGVTDVKHLKSRIRDEDQHKVNSPWNIAADFNIDMSLSADGIMGMLDDYENDHHTGMNTAAIAKQIRQYTNGYPYLVSRICQIVASMPDQEKFKTISEAWTSYGVDDAVRMLLQESDNSLFESLTGKLVLYPGLKNHLRNILLRGEVYAWLPYDEGQQMLRMYGFIRNEHNTVAISNRVFEMLLYTHFIGEADRNETLKQSAAAKKSIFVDEDGWLDVPKIMEHFIIEHNRIHRPSKDAEKEDRFLEAEGRERFLTYLSPIINGTGTWSIEEETRNQKRMDVVVHYLGRRYVIEMKIWRGERYNEEGEKQILAYLDHFQLDTGYMVSFNFNKNKESKVERIKLGNRTLFEGTV